ncbi:hypothetical protein [Micromonospora haikouensis]|uniref:hypothetical protein n=1 Tax=Micromonospora haikouensis TaxID=686309 RepID=UPI003D74478C
MTIIAAYSGPATVHVEGEGSWHVEVDLVAEEEMPEGLKHWHGKIQIVNEGKWAVLNANLAKLELPDGRTGKFLFRGDDLSGSGPAPFGDR